MLTRESEKEHDEPGHSARFHRNMYGLRRLYASTNRESPRQS